MLKRLFLIIGCFCLSGFAASPLMAEDPYLTGTILEDTVTYEGMERSFLLYMPDGDISGKPLFMVLHGSKGTGRDIRKQSGYQFDVLADTEKCAVLYPDGYKKHWNGCRNAPQDAAHKKNIDDVGFLLALADLCAERWHADPRIVYAVGYSNGAHMCFRLAIEAPDRIAGITAIAANMPAPGWSKCSNPGKHVPVMIVNGTDDPINPYEGGMVRLLLLIKKGKVRSSMDSARAWLLDDDQNNQPVTMQMEDRNPDDKSRVEIHTWPASKVRLYTVHGGGHTIPGGSQFLPKAIIGPTNQDMDIAQEVWGFLAGSD